MEKHVLKPLLLVEEGQHPIGINLKCVFLLFFLSRVRSLITVQHIYGPVHGLDLSEPEPNLSNAFSQVRFKVQQS